MCWNCKLFCELFSFMILLFFKEKIKLKNVLVFLHSVLQLFCKIFCLIICAIKRVMSCESRMKLFFEKCSIFKRRLYVFGNDWVIFSILSYIFHENPEKIRVDFAYKMRNANSVTKILASTALNSVGFARMFKIQTLKNFFP